MNKAIIIIVFWGQFGYLDLLAQTDLPAQRPPDFSLSAKYDGGKQYYFTELYISSDSCFYRRNNQGRKYQKKFRLSKQQLDFIYNSLIINQLPKIETELSSDILYDRGGTMMAFGWSQTTQSFDVNDAYNSQVKPEWQAKWQAFQNDLRATIKHKARKKQFWLF
ncbi:MAG: hypothetical protein MUE85_02780 [Microscillaceae bacterium]|nr:hypothetical protein [Microscillaceae bacterium]